MLKIVSISNGYRNENKEKNKIFIKKVLLRDKKRANGFEAPEKIWVQCF